MSSLGRGEGREALKRALSERADSRLLSDARASLVCARGAKYSIKPEFT